MGERTRLLFALASAVLVGRPVLAEESCNDDRSRCCARWVMTVTRGGKRWGAWMEDSFMTERKAAKKSAETSAKGTSGKASKGFTGDERAAMKERAQELKADARRGPRGDQADEEGAVLAKIAEMPEPDRAMGERVHAIIKANAPVLSPRLWYGMPAYAKDGKVVCFFQGAHKFKTRYASLGFSDKASLDEGAMWPIAFALAKLTAAEAEKIGALVRKAAS